MRKLSLLLISIAAILLIGFLGGQQNANWTLSGHDTSNTRNQPLETRISTANAGTLTVKWTFTTGGDVSATPTVADGVVYFPDWAGNLYAVRADSGQLIWAHRISDYTRDGGSVSRVSPAIYRDQLILGDNVAQGIQLHNGARIMAVDRASGSLRWMTQIDSHPAAVITGPPVVFGDVVYAGVSSNEEFLAQSDAYQCCTFRGSIAALNAATGDILWQTFVVPENGGRTGGYSGNAVWQPPAVDAARRLLYVGVGNNYTVPTDVEACPPTENCTPPNNYADSALALDLNTGAVKWAQRLAANDALTLACNSPVHGRNCPTPAGPDFDFGGSGPNLMGSLVGFGQKSGIYWTFDPNSGNVVWSRFVGPGGTLGGIEWGTATDGRRIYVAIGNNGHLPYTVGGREITWGSWAALDAATGKILWHIADPTPGATDPASMSVANGVVYTGSYSGFMYALDAATGAMLWSFNSGGSVLASPAIVNGILYWGSGYRRIPPGIANNKLYAFGLP